MCPVDMIVLPIRMWAIMSPSLCVSLTLPRIVTIGAMTRKIRSAALGALLRFTPRNLVATVASRHVHLRAVSWEKSSFVT
jgi:hypothetical protein